MGAQLWNSQTGFKLKKKHYTQFFFRKHVPLVVSKLYTKFQQLSLSKTACHPRTSFTLQDSCFTQLYVTGWTHVNLLYFPDSIEIDSIEGLTLCCPEKLTNQNSCWQSYVRFSWPEDNEIPPRCRHCLFLTCSYQLFFDSM